MDTFLKIVFGIALVLGVCYFAIWYSNYVSEKERMEREAAEAREQQKRDEIAEVEKRHSEIEAQLREEIKRKEQELCEIERNKRFIYDRSFNPPKARFVKDNFDDYVNSIKAPYLEYVVCITKKWHETATEILKITLEDFPGFDVSPHFSVNLAALLLRVATHISFKYNGQLQEVSRSVNKSLEKLFLLCGFNENLDATNLNSDIKLMQNIYFFEIYFDEDPPPFQEWVTTTYGRTDFDEQTITTWCNYFFDMIFLPVFFSATKYEKIYANRENVSIKSPSEAQRFYVDHLFNLIIDYCDALVEMFEDFFSVSRLEEIGGTDNDDLAWMYEYDSSDFKLFDYYYPFER